MECIFEFRLSAPSFDQQQLWITADAADGDAMRTAVLGPDGEGATGTAGFAPIRLGHGEQGHVQLGEGGA